MLVTSLVLLCTVLFGVGRNSAPDGSDAGLRDDFESAELGGIPAGWIVPAAAAAGLTVEVSAEKPFEGARCVHSRRDESSAPEGFGNLMRTIDAKPYRGRQITLRAAVRSEGGARGQLWLRFDGPGKTSELIDNMGDRPVRNSQWKRYTLRGDVPEGADRIALGLIHAGGGDVWLDDFELTISGPAGAGIEPPRALDERGLANLTAFARLYGYVRHFHPSDAAAEANWDRLAIEGVRAVEPARDAAALADALQRFFTPVAPTLRVYAASGAVPQPAAELERSAAPPGSKLIRWGHRGFGSGAPRSIYSSRRERQHVAAELPTGWRKPADTLDVDLGGGVACRVPTVLFQDGTFTLPRAEVAVAAESSASGEEPMPRANDRATRLGAIVVAWNVFQHFYPYFDVVKTDWTAELPRALRSAATDDGERAFLDTLRRLVAALHDGHGYVSHPCDRDYAAVPCAWAWVGEKLVITALAPEGAAGLGMGDVVRAIDGVPIDKAYERAAGLISASTPQNTRHRALFDLARGKPESKVRLSIARPDGSEHEVEVVRQIGAGPVVERRPEPISQLEPGIWYVDLDRIQEADFEAALADLAGARGIVFDLRGYPRLSTAVIAHLIDVPVRCARWNVPEVVEPDRRDMRFVESGWEVEPKEPRFRAKAAFLIDGRAISYAETYMGIIEHYELATTVGETTAGTNGNVNPFVLPGGYDISWTGMKVLKHDGTRHHGVGIAPKIPVTRTVAGIAAGRDEFLERAIEAVRP